MAVVAYPFESLRRVSRTNAVLESLVARWTRARPIGAKVAKLVGATAHVKLVGSYAGVSAETFDPFAALAEVRLHGHSFFVGGASGFVRELAQKRLYGPEELAAPRPLTLVEHAVFAGLVAAAIVDAKIAGEVWPVVNVEQARARLNSSIAPSTAARSLAAPSAAASTTTRLPAAPSTAGSTTASTAASAAPQATSYNPWTVELVLEIEGRGAPVPIVVWCPSSLRVASPPPAPLPGWNLDVPIVVGSCALHREDVGRLQVRDVITVDRQLGLVVGDGLIALSATPGAVEAKVASDYVRRDMALPDDAHLELTVQLGTTRLSLRQLSDLVPGSIVSLGRPLSGPFEVRAAGRLVGQGELVDVDGELGVRIVSLQE